MSVSMNLTRVAVNEERRRELEQQIEAWKAKNGDIPVIPRGVSGERAKDPISVQRRPDGSVHNRAPRGFPTIGA